MRVCGVCSTNPIRVEDIEVLKDSQPVSHAAQGPLSFGVRACCLEPERRGIRNDCDSHSWPILPCSIYIVDRVAPG